MGVRPHRCNRCASIISILVISSTACASGRTSRSDEVAAKENPNTGPASGPTATEINADECRSRIDAIGVRRKALRVAREHTRPEIGVQICTPNTPVPRVEQGWQTIVESGARLYLPASGPIRFPVFDGEQSSLSVGAISSLKADTPYTDAEIAGELAKALERFSSLPVRDSAHEPLYVIAEVNALTDRLERVRAVVPASIEARLVVAKSTAGMVAEHIQRAPYTPDWLRKRITELATSGEGGLAALVDDIARAAGVADMAQETWPCQPLREMMDVIAQGASLSVDLALEGTEEALRACVCRGVDIDAVESLMLFMFAPYQRHGYLALPPHAQGLLPSGPKTIADLARVLTSTP